jgi:hypothetical protein
VEFPFGNVNVPVVLTGPVRTSGNVVVFATAAAPVTWPVMVSVPDACAPSPLGVKKNGHTPGGELPVRRPEPFAGRPEVTGVRPSYWRTT